MVRRQEKARKLAMYAVVVVLALVLLGLLVAVSLRFFVAVSNLSYALPDIGGESGVSRELLVGVCAGVVSGFTVAISVVSCRWFVTAARKQVVGSPRWRSFGWWSDMYAMFLVVVLAALVLLLFLAILFKVAVSGSR